MDEICIGLEGERFPGEIELVCRGEFVKGFLAEPGMTIGSCFTASGSAYSLSPGNEYDVINCVCFKASVKLPKEFEL